MILFLYGDDLFHIADDYVNNYSFCIKSLILETGSGHQGGKTGSSSMVLQLPLSAQHQPYPQPHAHKEHELT